MGSLKDEAKAYEPKQTFNIADLDRVDLSFPIEDRVGKDKNDKEFNYKVLVINNQEFRVPNTVLEKIKEMLDLKPDLKFVRVEKSGSGLNTKYSVKKVE